MSNGTAAGTVMVQQLGQDSEVGSYPSQFTLVNGVLFFTANDGTHGQELWIDAAPDAPLTPAASRQLQRDRVSDAHRGGSRPVGQ